MRTNECAAAHRRRGVGANRPSPQPLALRIMLKPIARRLLSYTRPHKAGYSFSILLFFLASGMEPLIPALLGHVLNEGFSKNTNVPLWPIPLMFIGIFAMRGALTFCAQYAMSWANARSVYDLRRDLVQALIGADARSFHEVTPGIAVTKVINDPQNAIGQIGGAVSTLLRDGTHTVVMLGYLFYLNWKLTLLALVTIPLLAYAVRQVHRRGLQVGSLMYQSQLRLVSVVDDIARAWRVVRTFDAGKFELERFSNEAQRFRRMTLKSTAATSLMTPVSQTITSLGVAAILWLALAQARSDATTVGEFVAFITALLLLVSRIRSLTDLSQTITSGFIIANGCFAILDLPKEPDDGEMELENAEGNISLEKISVHYSGSETSALQNVTLEIPAGKTVALVGASGAGKSTLVNLLLGFVEPSAGRVSLDGLPLGSLRKPSLRRQFAVVSQDIVLFEGSIATNVVYAKPRDDAKIEQCLRAANLWEHIESLPEKLGTEIGANGSRLSGGQRQRLAIARALYKEAPIWIFDEATSSLDTESERAVQAALEQWHGKKTLLLIAHRLSTVRSADRIYVLGGGTVLEEGDHATLMARNGIYASMVNAQT